MTTRLRDKFLAVPGESEEALKELFEFLTGQGYDLDKDISRGYARFYDLTDEQVEGFKGINRGEKIVVKRVLAGEPMWQLKVCGGLDPIP